MKHTWLVPAKVLVHWTFYLRPWVKSIGWFEDLIHGASDDVQSPWTITGPHKVDVSKYIQIVSDLKAEEKIYRFDGAEWHHIHGPILFTYRPNDTETYLVGYMVPKHLLSSEHEAEDPWVWENLTTVDVTPVIANYMETTARPEERDEQFPVFFMSNGETNAEMNWAHLKALVPRAQRVDGFETRHAAFMKCAELTDRSHFFVVTGKNYVLDPSVFAFKPLLDDKGEHYVFHAKNMSNDLVGGHMAVVLYNRSAVIRTPEDFGLDFTQYNACRTIPHLASNANFATSAFEAWRTAFREAVKLRVSATEEAESTLAVWMAYAKGPFAFYVKAGAREGVKFADEFHSNLALFESESWDWLWAKYCSWALSTDSPDALP